MWLPLHRISRVFRGEGVGMKRGPCAKRQVTCVITAQDGSRFSGENDCANAQDICPRVPGDDYTKCKTICQQGDHAEIKALRAAGDKAIGAVATIVGHYYICEPCGAALRDAHIAKVELVRRWKP